jgi:hypothetical protein
LNQLLTLEDQPDFLLEGVINFQKRVVVHFIANKFRSLVKNEYDFAPDPDVQKLIKTWKGLSDEECFNVSLESEPRESAATRYTRGESMVGFLCYFLCFVIFFNFFF